MYPNIQSGLIETAAPGSDSDAPKAGTVLVVGSAGAGPTTPTVIGRPDDAYKLYGTQGKLAQTIELALQGASIGAQIANNGLKGRVVALRTETGDTASVVLVDAADIPVMKITTLDAGETANNFSVSPIESGSLRGYSIYDPIADQTIDIPVDFSGTASAGAVSTPSQLAETITTLLGDKLDVEVYKGDARFELAISSETEDGDSAKIVSASSGKSTIDFTTLALADAQALQPSTLLYLDQPKGNSLTAEVYNNILSDVNEDARFYSITAGKAIAVGKGATQVRIENLANSAIVGQDGIKTLINIRTTGIGENSEVDFEDATERDGSKVSEGYYRVRNYATGRFDRTLAATDHDFGAGDVPAYAVSFPAPQGIADEGGPLSTAYAATASAMTAAEASTDRLGTKPDDFFTLQGRRLGVTTLEPITLDLGGGTGVEADLAWDSGTGTATVYLNKSEYDTAHASKFDEGELFVNFDSGVFDLSEVAFADLNPSLDTLQYAVDSTGLVVFNQALDHELVVRPLRITQYRLGDSVIVERTEDGGNKFHFHGQKQPGEAGLSLSESTMSAVFGFDYEYEPKFPDIDLAVDGPATFSGGTSGVNASAQEKLDALSEALATYRDVDYKILVVSDLYLDDTTVSYDQITGERIEKPISLLKTLQAHQERQSRTGASGIVYASVKPMIPATSSGRFTDVQKLARLQELTVVDGDKPGRAANVIAEAGTLPDFFLFDAPMRVQVGGRSITTDGTALLAGVRSALPNNHTLYQKTFNSTTVEALYRYDVADQYLPSILADAKINTWAERRGETRLATERTAAGKVVDDRGKLVDSNFQSGTALLVAKEFLKKSVARLENLIGPLPSGGVDVLRGTTVTELRSVAGSVVGIQAIDIDDQADITIRATGGSTLGMFINVLLLINGELHTIDIRVGTLTEVSTQVGTASVAGISLAG